MIRITAPEDTSCESFKKVFLAGSIEQGRASSWQKKLSDELADVPKLMIFDPRREEWDDTWEQDPTPGTQFHEQVTWELKHILRADIVVFYFDPETQSPVTLLELGYCLGSSKPVIVCCPDGYFRKGNVVLTCNLKSVPVLNSYDQLVSELKSQLGVENEPVMAEKPTETSDKEPTEEPEK